MSPSDAAGAGAVRTPVYLISIASCLVLSWIFVVRENWLGLVLVIIGALAYSVRLVMLTRTQRRAAVTAARGPKARTSAEQEMLKTELAQMRAAYERSRRIMLMATALIAGVATVVWTWNPQLALALLIVAIPSTALMWRNASAVRKIDAGLASAR